MGKLDEKKRQKRESLLHAAFSLFTSQGINDTSISDIVKKADMAKGTFYLYFKDKVDIRNKLIADKATQLLCRAGRKMKIHERKKGGPVSLEGQIIFIADTILDELNQDKRLLDFISKNLSWGVFQNLMASSPEEDGEESFHDLYCMMLKESGREFRNPKLMLYMIVELINSTCHNVILRQKPVTLEELKPELYHAIEDIIHRQEITVCL